MTKVDEDTVERTVLAQALEDSGHTPLEASRILGWGNDSSRVKRFCGLEKDSRNKTIPPNVPYNKAADFIQGLGLYPVDYGV